MRRAHGHPTRIIQLTMGLAVENGKCFATKMDCFATFYFKKGKEEKITEKRERERKSKCK